MTCRKKHSMWTWLQLIYFLIAILLSDIDWPFQDIDIKKVNGVPQYAFLQYCDIASVCKAIKKMDGEYLGNNRLKVSKAHKSLYLICFKGLRTLSCYFRVTEGQLLSGKARLCAPILSLETATQSQAGLPCCKF